jgi:hypothetical protein
MPRPVNLNVQSYCTLIILKATSSLLHVCSLFILCRLTCAFFNPFNPLAPMYLLVTKVRPAEQVSA